MTKQYSKHTRTGALALLIWLGVFSLLLASKPSSSISGSKSVNPIGSGKLQTQLSRLPLSFEENRGQASEGVRFIARQPGYTVYLSDGEARFEMSHKAASKAKTTLRVKLASGTSNTRVEGLEQLSSKSNYFIGNDSREWRTDIPTFSRITQRDIYPGVDAIFYGNQRQLEYDFTVAPQSDPRQIALAFDGADKLELNEQGDLLIELGGDQLLMRKPVIYQPVNGERRAIEGGFSLRDKKVGFEVGDYDRDLPLVIDPVVDYSTYFGGGGTDISYGIVVDRLGFVYITGQTGSLNYPTINAYQTMRDGATDAIQLVAEI